MSIYKEQSNLDIKNEGYLSGLVCALGIIKHSNDLNKAEQSVRNAISQAELIKKSEWKEENGSK